VTYSLRDTVPDTPENRESMFQVMVWYDGPFQNPATKRRRDGFPFFLVVNRGKIGFVTGADAKDADFTIAQWHPRNGVTRLDAARHEIRTFHGG